MAQEEFLLKWNDHHVSFFNIVEELCRSEQLCDVTLACGGQVFETHKLILSVCSPYFRALLSRTDKTRHPIIYLKDVNPAHLQLLLSYMYKGEINVLQNDLGPLIETAKGLHIKGLADAGDSSDQSNEDHQQPSPQPQIQQPLQNGDVHRNVGGGVVAPQQITPLQPQPIHPPQLTLPQRPLLPVPSQAPKRMIRPIVDNIPNVPSLTPKIPKLDKVKSLNAVSLPQLAPIPPQALNIQVPTSVVSGVGGVGIVINDNNSGGGVSGGGGADKIDISNTNMVKMEQEESNDWSGIEEIPQDTNTEKTSFEQELQQEDEQYIQPEGLSQQQITMLQREIQKKYPCEFCHKRFPTPSKLNRHKLVHSGEKPYCCHLCKKGFTQKVHLNTHMKMSHGNLMLEQEHQHQLQQQQQILGGIQIGHQIIHDSNSNSGDGLGDSGHIVIGEEGDGEGEGGLEDGEVLPSSFAEHDEGGVLTEGGGVELEDGSSDTENQLFMDIQE
eukprot:TRINITY_DN7669_c0_g1_i2.p1 TRINITY_DN7669_c0_g1~~TRINITY_DN7669_c0_g1_i2.p1  ORF type:complete len:497 (+),score=121.60 TRINITY_DN7669_c0_g1_i2:105-1595(+)